MTTLHDLASPYPFVPHHLFGSVLEKDGRRVILWKEDGSAQAWAKSGKEAPEDEATDGLVSQVETVGRLFKQMSMTHGDAVRALESQGFRYVATRTYDFRSGILLANARYVAALALRAGDEREGIRLRNDGHPPYLQGAEWDRWVEVTTQMNSCAMGARLLGIAAAEAIVNEILAMTFPEDYKEMEDPAPLGCGQQHRAGPIRRLKRLCELIGLTPEPAWVAGLDKEYRFRIEIAHHKPRYLDDDSPLDSVAPGEVTDPNKVKAFVDLVEHVFRELFGAFGLTPPHLE